MNSALPYVGVGAVIVTALPLLFRYPKSSQEGATEVYRCSFGFLVFAWLLTLIVAAVPLLFRVGGVELDSVNIALWASISTMFLLATLSVSLYRIVVGRDSIVIGGFWRRVIAFRDINEVSVRFGGQGYTFLFIQYRGKRRISVSSYSADLQALERSIKAKIQALPGK